MNTIFITHVQKKIIFQVNMVLGYYDFWLLQLHIFAKFPQNSVLRFKLCTINSICTQKVSPYWFGVKILWLKDVFYNTVIFSIFCISKLFKLYGGTERRLAFCVYLYLGHDLWYPCKEKVIFVKHFFFLLLLLYVEWSHFLPSNDQKI